MRDIAVIGAGIGGLAAAALLHVAGHRVTIFERFDAPRAVGSGLVIQPVGLAVLDAVGAGAAARAQGAWIARMVGHDGRRRVLSVAYPAAAPGLALHRGALFGALWDVVRGLGVSVVTGAQVTGVPLAGGRRFVETDGGKQGPFDLIVDAGGAGSVISPLQAKALPFGAIWGHVPWPDGVPQVGALQQAYRGAARMAGILPIGRLPGDDVPRAAVFWSMPAAELAVWPGRDVAAWKAEVAGLWPQMGVFLEDIRGTDQMTVARYAHGTLGRPYAQGLVHIGDAAHRASPQLVQGANMALLDAFALAHALRGDDPLATYARMRRWHVRVYQAMSWAFTPMYQSHSRVLPALRNHVLAPVAEWPGVRGVLTRLVSGRLLPPLSGVRFSAEAQEFSDENSWLPRPPG